MTDSGPPSYGASGGATSGSRQEAAPGATPWMPPHAGTTPNAERYLLEADALRRRQLHSALLHGSSRTWRDRRRIWPAMIAGVVVVSVIVAVFIVIHALDAERDRQEQEEQQNAAGLPASVTVPDGSGSGRWAIKSRVGTV